MTVMEAAPDSNRGIEVLQTSALPLGYAAGEMERAMGFEPTTSTLARLHSTTELRPPSLLIIKTGKLLSMTNCAPGPLDNPAPLYYGYNTNIDIVLLNVKNIIF